MTGHGVLLIARHRVSVHAGKEVVGLVVLADVIEAEVPILIVLRAALGRTVRALVGTIRPFAGDRGLTHLLLLRARLVRLDANGIEEFG
jgi:hypothetical protein